MLSCLKFPNPTAQMNKLPLISTALQSLAIKLSQWDQKPSSANGSAAETFVWPQAMFHCSRALWMRSCSCQWGTTPKMYRLTVPLFLQSLISVTWLFSYLMTDCLFLNMYLRYLLRILSKLWCSKQTWQNKFTTATHSNSYLIKFQFHNMTTNFPCIIK